MKKMVLNSLVFFLLLSIIFEPCTVGSPVKNPEKYKLKYNMKKGTRFTMTSSSTTDITQEMQGMEMNVTTKSQFEYTFEVISVNENGMKMEIVFKDRKYSSDGFAGSSTRNYSELLGKKAEFILSIDGKISGYSKLEDLPAVDIGNDLTADEAYYKDLLNDLFPVLPDKPLSIGESWTYEVESEERFLSPDGKLKTTYKYTYKILEETEKEGIKCLKIERKHTEVHEGAGVQQNIDVSVEGEGEGTEIIYFDLEKGMLLTIEKDKVVEGTASAESMGITMPYARKIKSEKNVIFK